MHHKNSDLTTKMMFTDSLSVAASLAKSASARLSASFARCNALMASDFKLACMYVCVSASVYVLVCVSVS